MRSPGSVVVDSVAIRRNFISFMLQVPVLPFLHETALSIQQFIIVTIPIKGLLVGNFIIGLSGFIRHLDGYYTLITPDTKAT